MAELIEGLHIDIETTELRGLLDGRLTYHRERVKQEEAQVTSLRAAAAGAEQDRDRIGKTSNRGLVETAEESLRKHKDQVIYYDFVSKHLVVGAIYRLAEGDLLRIGIKGAQYY